MNHSTLTFLWQDPQIARGYRTGVSLHGHTLHSKECLSFLPRYLCRVPGVSHMVRRHQRRVDFSRAYWTPPLTPASAIQLEQSQIFGLGLRPLVSLTDHDDIEAGMLLESVYDRGENPVSVEWTVPFGGSIFHLGIHNLPRRTDRAWMAAMSAYTQSPDDRDLPHLLDGLAAIPQVLVVLNHPFWLEEGVEAGVHRGALQILLGGHLQWIHAFELNGTRAWSENRDTVTLAAQHERPVISGGDRHACEPSACINLTSAADFPDFAAEIRTGVSTVAFLPHYREPIAARMLEAARDILRPYPEYPGREQWTDRIYYRSEDGQARQLSLVWNGGTPWVLQSAAGLVELIANKRLRPAIRLLLAEHWHSAL